MKYEPLKKGCLNCNKHLGWKLWNANIRWCDRYCKESFANQYFGIKGRKRLFTKGCKSDRMFKREGYKIKKSGADEKQ
mgnify:CR=1 FL=1